MNTGRTLGLSSGIVPLVILGLFLIGCAEKTEQNDVVLVNEAAVDEAIEQLVDSVNYETVIVEEGEGASLIEQNKAVVRAYKQAQWSESSRQLLAPGFTVIRREFENLAFNAEDSAIAPFVDSMNLAIPDRVDRIEEIVAEGDIVGIQTRVTGTHLGNLYGIPATGKSIDIVSFAFYKLVDNKIVEAWEMADEADLLRQLGEWLPERSDGVTIAPSIKHPTRLGSEVLAEIKASPEDSDRYLNKVSVSTYKSEDPPWDKSQGRPYEIYKRAGFYHFGVRGNELGQTGQGITQAFPDRLDRVGLIIAEGDKVMIQFLLTGTNAKSLFGNPASKNKVAVWEVGVHTFEGTTWKTGWWFGDDIGMMLQIGAPKEFMVP